MINVLSFVRLGELCELSRLNCLDCCQIAVINSPLLLFVSFKTPLINGYFFVFTTVVYTVKDCPFNNPREMLIEFVHSYSIFAPSIGSPLQPW